MVRISQPALSTCVVNGAPSPRGSASGRSGGCSAGTARLRRSVGEVLRPGKDRAANPTWSPPNAKRPPGTWCVARDRAELVAQAEACAGHSSCVPQAPASDRPPLALPENRWNGLTLVQVGHGNMLSLAKNPKTPPLQSANDPLMGDLGQVGHNVTSTVRILFRVLRSSSPSK